jgi:hypothetical protein
VPKLQLVIIAKGRQWKRKVSIETIKETGATLAAAMSPCKTRAAQLTFHEMAFRISVLHLLRAARL